MSESCILFFLKYPELGRVKTRLARSVGDDQAMEAFRWMVEKCWKQAESAPAHRQVYGTPESQINAFNRWLPSRQSAAPQPEGSLGDRLTAGVEYAFNKGHSKVICVGGDCPTLRAEDYAKAFDALDDHDIALYPADDGGYVLIGLKASNPAIFQNISWSTAWVYQQTIDQADSLGLSTWVGSSFPDIDTFADWQQNIQPHFPDAPDLKVYA